MAKRGSRGAGKGGGGDRQARATSKKAAPAPVEIEVVEEAGGEGVDTGMAIATTVILLVAILFLDALVGGYDQGFFFK